MKNILFFLLTLLPFLASAQTPEIIDIQQELVLDGGNYYVLTTTTYAEGPPMVVPTKIGNAEAMLDFALNSAVNRQQDIASVIRRALEEETLSYREFKGVDTLVTSITGGDTTLFSLVVDKYFSELQGRYRLRNSSGTIDLFFNLIRLANGGVRLEQEVTLTRYTVQILSPHNFRILNLPVGAIPATTYPCYEISPAPNGNRVFQDNMKIFKLTKVQ